MRDLKRSTAQNYRGNKKKEMNYQEHQANFLDKVFVVIAQMGNM